MRSIKGQPNPVDVLVGARIRRFRKGRSMTQAQLADRLGVTFQQVQKYENGKNRVGASRLHLVATALDIPVAQLFSDGTTKTAKKPISFDPETLRFAEAFVKITDKGLRDSILDTVEAMARKSEEI
jgi:transcriptional regulator with XRE-family HTH domain